ncbi:bifunctional UDP-sugar hydrolase/5'-nucleotidase [Massilibacteroides sp.]|uniref:bifunctional metallophosphatase/5'-nucleotidase n=1 Tax=Massilibacteroides sp. TaxID=2034766 RepID=UPI0026165B3F|nr:bifunctional UDP-sugar hydrolase/5'-nucleotidase [Massilibacteroides sp.]MDD4514076.1 bifunctional UDP-sugar hydrolase/5'-nucleotidase [Massilibacteroides sp.]
MKSKILLFIGLAIAFGSCKTSKKTVAKESENQTVEILAVNDIHANIDNFPRFGFMVDSLRAIYPDLLLFSAGDNQTGNPANDQYSPKGLPMIELMNALKFDVTAVGNHEFDAGQKGFAFLTEQSHFPYLCANVSNYEASGIKIKPYHIISMDNGVKLAIFSLLSINSGGIPDSHPMHLEGLQFQRPENICPDYYDLAKKNNCDALILLSHVGFEGDVKLAEQAPQGSIDLIIGGHTHTTVKDEKYINNILITQSGSKLRYISLIKLTIKDKQVIGRSMELLPINKKGNERADIRSMVDKYNDNPSLNVTVAVAEDDFSSPDKVGYLMVDALRSKTNADIALINPGGIRIGYLDKGNVTVMDVYKMDPFGNEITLFNLTGEELKSLHISAFKSDVKSPMCPSGIQSVYTLNPDGSIKEIEFFTESGEPLDMNKTYLVAMNSYMSAAYRFDHKDPGKSLFRTTAESMIEYLKELRTIPSYRNEQRTKVIKE